MASIYKRNGVYNVVVTYTDENGKRRQKWESFHSEAEAMRRKTEIEYHQGLGIHLVQYIMHTVEVIMRNDTGLLAVIDNCL